MSTAMSAMSTHKSTRPRLRTPNAATTMSKLVSFCLFVPTNCFFINHPLKSRLFLYWFTRQTLILVVQSVVFLAGTNCEVRTERVEICQRCLKMAKCKICLRHLAPHCFHAKDVCHACHRKVTKTRVRRAVEEIVNETTIPTTSGDMSFDQFIEDNANYIRQIVDTYRQRFGSVLLCFYTTNCYAFAHEKKMFFVC